jgi:hypothetical protein
MPGDKRLSKKHFYVELEQVSHHFPKYKMKIILGDFNAILGTEVF